MAKEERIATTAHTAHQELVQQQLSGKLDEWELARKLYYLRRYDLWRFAVGSFDSWEDYLKQPEIAITRHRADKLVRIYEYFIVHNTHKPEDLKDIPWSALDYISKQNVDKYSPKYDEILEAAKGLTLKDLKELYFELNKEPEEERTYTYVLMKKCDQTGNLEKVHGIESDTIKEALKL